MLLRYDQLTEVPSAPSVALSCVGTLGSIGRPKPSQQSNVVWQPTRFRSFRRSSAAYVGARLGRKLGPEDKSHKFHIIAVAPGRTVA